MKMKKTAHIGKVFYLSVFFCILLTLVFTLNVSANDKITVVVDGAELKFDVEPEIINGRTMVPFRLIFEALGAQINYNAETSEVTATRIYNGNPESVEFNKHVMPAYVKLKIGDNYMETVIDKKLASYWLDAAPYIKNGRTLVPVRAISESFGANVSWDAKTKTVNIFSNLYISDSSDIYGGHLQMYITDRFTYYNGKLEFTFTKSSYNNWGGTEFVWDGEQLYEGRISPFEHTLGIDKTSNKVIYSTKSETSKKNGVYTETEKIYLSNFDGTNTEEIARIVYEQDRDSDDINHSLIILGHPEYWGIADEETEEIIHVFTEPGTYDVYEKWLQFIFNDNPEYANSEQFNEQYSAYIDDDTLFYTSAINGEALSITLPMAWPQHKCAEIMLKTPRYIFVRTLANEHDIDVPIESREAFFTGLYAVDRFENTLTFIQSKSSEGPSITLEQFNGTSSSGGGSSTTPSGGGSKSCLVCGGRGSISCTVCNGSGKVKSYIGGEHSKNCSACSGRGSRSCKTCGGDGRVQDNPNYQ